MHARAASPKLPQHFPARSESCSARVRLTGMQTLVLIRHAVAEERETWTGSDDAKRPLTEAGRRQAERIAREVMKMAEAMERDAAIVSLRSSPALRCVDTVRPLAKRAGLALDVDANLMEGRTIGPPPPREQGMHILCAHGDNIPWLLDELKIEWNGRCKKGSIWVIERDGRGKVLASRYQSVTKD